MYVVDILRGCFESKNMVLERLCFNVFVVDQSPLLLFAQPFSTAPNLKLRDDVLGQRKLTNHPHLHPTLTTGGTWVPVVHLKHASVLALCVHDWLRQTTGHRHPMLNFVGKHPSGYRYVHLDPDHMVRMRLVLSRIEEACIMTR